MLCDLNIFSWKIGPTESFFFFNLYLAIRNKSFILLNEVHLIVDWKVHRLTNRMWQNEANFSTCSSLLTYNSFHRYCSTWIRLVKRVINSRYYIIIWPSQILNFSAHPRHSIHKFHWERKGLLLILILVSDWQIGS